MHDMRGPQPAHAMTATMEHVVEQILSDKQHDERDPARLPRVDAIVIVEKRVDGDDGEPRELVGGLLHQCERGVAERVAPAIELRARLRAPQVPRLPADACEKDWRHGEQQQFGIELHCVFLRGPWPPRCAQRVLSLLFERDRNRCTAPAPRPAFYARLKHCPTAYTLRTLPRAASLEGTLSERHACAGFSWACCCAVRRRDRKPW